MLRYSSWEVSWRRSYPYTFGSVISNRLGHPLFRRHRLPLLQGDGEAFFAQSFARGPHSLFLTGGIVGQHGGAYFVPHGLGGPVQAYT